MIFPQGHYKSHSSFQSFVSGIHATLLQKICAILSLCNPILAEVCCDTVVFVAIHRVQRMFNGLTILMVKLFHLLELAKNGVVINTRSEHIWWAQIKASIQRATWAMAWCWEWVWCWCWPH